MLLIFGYAWERTEGPQKFDGKHTQPFLLWCEKTANLTDQQWADGFEVLENRVKQDIEIGRKAYPPSYIEFITFCNMKPKPTRYYKPKPLPDAAQQQKDHEAGVIHLEKIKKLLRG